MTTTASQLVTTSLHSHALARVTTAPAGRYPASELAPTRVQRVLSLLLDGGILVVGVWSIPFVIIALVTPFALCILGVLQLIRLLQNAF